MRPPRWVIAQAGFLILSLLLGAGLLADRQARSEGRMAGSARHLNSGRTGELPGDRVATPAEPQGSPAAPSFRYFTVSGEVHLPGGNPADRASILLLDDEARGDVGSSQHPLEENDRATSTDPLGRFAFEGVAPGSKRLLAVQEGFPPIATSPFPVERNVERIVTLVTGTTLGGRTAPLAELRVLSRGIPGFPRLPALPAPSTRADPSGRYELPPIPAGFPFLVQARSPHCSPKTFGPLTFPPGTQSQDFPLVPGLTLEGRIASASGLGIEGARVTLRGRTTVSGADGSYLLEGLDEKPGTLLVSREGFCPVTRPEVGPGRQEVTLEESRSLRGRLTGPRPPGPITVFHERTGIRYRTLVAPDGRFELKLVGAGPVRIVVRDGGERTIAERTVIVPEETEDQEVLVRLR